MYINLVLKRILCQWVGALAITPVFTDKVMEAHRGLNTLLPSPPRKWCPHLVPLTHADHHLCVRYFFFPSSCVFLKAIFITHSCRECLPLENVLSIWGEGEVPWGAPQSCGSKGNKVGSENPSEKSLNIHGTLTFSAFLAVGRSHMTSSGQEPLNRRKPDSQKCAWQSIWLCRMPRTGQILCNLRNDCEN